MFKLCNENHFSTFSTIYNIMQLSLLIMPTFYFCDCANDKSARVHGEFAYLAFLLLMPSEMLKVVMWFFLNQDVTSFIHTYNRLFFAVKTLRHVTYDNFMLS